MNINRINSSQNFGRAFTSKEKKDYSHLIKDSQKELELSDTTAIIFDFNVPSEKGYNTGIGTTFSDAMKNFTKFLKSMTGITSVQLQPQGKITDSNTSPYSGTAFAYGEQIIDLKKLASPKYGALLSLKDIKAADENYPDNKNEREYKTNYNYVIGKNKGIQEGLLKTAYNNFKEKSNTDNQIIQDLNEEFINFQRQNSYWLEKDSIFEALKTHYNNDDYTSWNEPDKNLYSKNCPKDIREQRIAEIQQQYGEIIEFEKFKQFIADKQQKESREFLNSENIKLYGDCLIGFYKSEIWANIDCFRDNLYYGGPDPNCPETNNIQPWGLNALDYTKLGECLEDGDLSKLGETGKLLYDKYTTFFKRYDGIRMDAAWQFITPFVYQTTGGNYEEFKLPDINFTILNIMKAAAKNTLGAKFDENNPDNIMLELVGISADKSRAATLNTYPHLYSTAYAEYDETPYKFLEKGYKNGKFYTGTGNHDNDSLINMAKDKEKRSLHLNGIKRDYNLNTADLSYNLPEYQHQSEEEKIQEDFRTAKLAEIYTSSKQFFTLPDAFGMSERINISGKTDKNNWTVRIPSDYEKFYYSQLSKGFGLNIPKVYANAMRMKQCNNEKLIQKCNEAAEILRSEGPLTTQEADILEKENRLKNKFEYLS
ncbi:MAG: 4-alpha-glucanotransferase [Candidatus Gastranaerophilales bacterium]|nr:4-alpha-glucanotransferase [Candidatus Gastranaerophilales bacterium]